MKRLMEDQPCYGNSVTSDEGSSSSGNNTVDLKENPKSTSIQYKRVICAPGSSTLYSPSMTSWFSRVVNYSTCWSSTCNYTKRRVLFTALFISVYLYLVLMFYVVVCNRFPNWWSWPPPPPRNALRIQTAPSAKDIRDISITLTQMTENLTDEFRFLRENQTHTTVPKKDSRFEKRRKHEIDDILDEYLGDIAMKLLRRSNPVVPNSSSSSSSTFPLHKGPEYYETSKQPVLVVDRPTPRQVDFALHVICHEKDWMYLPNVLESISLQTYLPSEVIFVLNLHTRNAKATLDESNGILFNHKLFKVVPQSVQTKVFFRTGPYSASSNRNFALQQSTSDLLSFFDCYDYMHPQRMEILYKLFSRYPPLHIIIHELYTLSYLTSYMDFLYPNNKLEVQSEFTKLFPQHLVDSIEPVIKYEKVWQQIPSELNQNFKKLFHHHDQIFLHHVFTRVLNLKWLDESPIDLASDGWIAIRRVVMKTIEFPDTIITIGRRRQQQQDSFFTWIPTQYGFNFTALPLKLGVHLINSKSNTLVQTTIIS